MFWDFSSILPRNIYLHISSVGKVCIIQFRQACVWKSLGTRNAVQFGNVCILKDYIMAGQTVLDGEDAIVDLRYMRQQIS